MDLDLLDNLPPPTISLSATRSWSMSKFIDFPEDLPGDEEDHHNPQIDGYRYPGESRYLPMDPVSRGILIQGSGEYVHPQDAWASSFSKRNGSTDSQYYPADSVSYAGTPSPTSTTGHTFLSGDIHGPIGTSLDSDSPSITSPNSDGSDSSGNSVHSTSEGHQVASSRLSVPSFSPSVHAQSGSHSPISIYSTSSPSPLVLSATSSPRASYLPVPDKLPSPLQHPQEDYGPMVNMSDIYSPSSAFDLHTQDAYNLTFSLSEFDESRLQHFPPLLVASASYEAELESEFEYHSPFRAIDAELEQPLGKRTRLNSDVVDNISDRKRVRRNSPAHTMEKKKRGRPRKSEPALISQAEASPPTTLIDSDEEFLQGGENDSDSDVYVPSDEEGARRIRGRGRKGSGSGSGNADTLRELELRANGAQQLSVPSIFEPSGLTSVDDAQSAVHRRQNGRRSQPVPVPNVTKKSRGRKVPVSGEDAEAPSPPVYHPFDFDGAGTGADFVVDTVAPRGRPVKTFTQDIQSCVEPEHPPTGVANEPFKVVSGGIKKLSGERRYVCTVDGCGKCFVRGEHLKRHVRSLHTWEKPHKCPHPGCGKSFSRRDNLGQHVRVHL
ncbi:hypothetical protein E1B28_006936 [Marasmius oreades]|uniref:C2H2-type domain-containing protein n=1 Tax=Marasmius oreades TaxID=181124 RepID=A0A9P7S1A8_9AGAR|nr:uncharacterized protein E1B28_006936 [Marasmius oreades]KAG7093250.1 hypothetical protein E1B28_006936 [Marasmius oreades]